MAVNGSLMRSQIGSHGNIGKFTNKSVAVKFIFSNNLPKTGRRL